MAYTIVISGRHRKPHTDMYKEIRNDCDYDGYELYADLSYCFGLKILIPLFCVADCTCTVTEL